MTQTDRNWQNIFQAIGHPTVILDPQHRILAANRAVELASKRPETDLIGRKCHEIFHGRDCASPPEGCPMERLLASGRLGTVEGEMQAFGGVYLVSCTPVLDPQGRVTEIIHIATDISERKRAEEEIREMSFRDEMTELYNRRGFVTLAEQQLKAANRAGRPMRLTFVDCDGLKRINDTLGHETGNQALVETADILRQTFRETDIIARMGGDEFAVLAIETADLGPEAFSERLQQNIARLNSAASRSYRLSLSWGTALYDPQSPVSLDQLMSAADGLMYAQKRAKSAGRD